MLGIGDVAGCRTRTSRTTTATIDTARAIIHVGFLVGGAGGAGALGGPGLAACSRTDIPTGSWNREDSDKGSAVQPRGKSDSPILLSTVLTPEVYCQTRWILSSGRQTRGNQSFRAENLRGDSRSRAGPRWKLGKLLTCQKLRRSEWRAPTASETTLPEKSRAVVFIAGHGLKMASSHAGEVRERQRIGCVGLPLAPVGAEANRERPSS